MDKIPIKDKVNSIDLIKLFIENKEIFELYV